MLQKSSAIPKNFPLFHFLLQIDRSYVIIKGILTAEIVRPECRTFPKNEVTYMDDKEFYLDAIRDIVPEQKENQLQTIFYSFLELEHLYDSAIELVKAQLNIFDNEFSMRFQRNPIHNIESRIKTPQSIVGKLQRKGYAVSPESARKHLMDIAGVRVICCYIDDIYALAELLTVGSGFKVLKTKDYIKNPKGNGYRSFHMIVSVPVHMSTGVEYAPVEIQIRTIAMDFWASLEHQLHYKSVGNKDVSSGLTEELKECADSISEIDIRMQDMFKQINEL